jgi:hypothetical protein
MSEHAHNTTDAIEDARPFGMLAEFENVDALLKAANGVRFAGYTRWDCFTPFPVHGLNKAMGLRPTRLPLLVLGAGITGALAGIVLQLYTMATTFEGLPSFAQGYKFIISGKPFASGPAFIPVTFELTILLAALTAFGAMMLMNGLPRLYHPMFKSERFRRVTTDRFFVAVDARDPLYDADQTRALFESLGATHVEELES